MRLALQNPIVRITLGLCVTGVFLWAVLKNVEFQRVIFVVAQVRWYVLPISLVFLFADYAVRAARWWAMLHACGMDVTFGASARSLLISVSINNVAPLRVGDAVRIVSFPERGQPMRVAGALLLEKLLDTTVLFAFLLGGIAYLERIGSPLVPVGAVGVAGGLIFLAWAVAILFADKVEYLVRRVCQHRSVATRSSTEFVQRHLSEFFSALRIVRKSGLALRLLLLSATAWLLEGAVFQTIAQGLDYQGHWYGPWFAFAASTFATLIPSSPGYVGTFDFFAISGLVAYGASRTMAAALAFLVHAVLWLPLTIAGLACTLISTSSVNRETIAAAFGRGRGNA